MNSVCKDLNCPHFSEGVKQDGITYGYGCSNYSVALHCPLVVLSEIKPSQYELFWSKESLSPMDIEAAKILLKSMVLK